MKTIRTKVSDNLEVVIIPNKEHEFLMTSKDVASAYGISQENLRSHQRNYKDELFEGKHFVKGATIMSTLEKNAQPHQTFWTKRGVLLLSFFIKSGSSKLFRDWAEDLIIEQLYKHNAKLIIL